MYVFNRVEIQPNRTRWHTQTINNKQKHATRVHVVVSFSFLYVSDLPLTGTLDPSHCSMPKWLEPNFRGYGYLGPDTLCPSSPATCTTKGRRYGRTVWSRREPRRAFAL